MRALTDQGYDCFVAESIQECERACRTQPLDLVLTSLYLKDGPASELCHRLRRFSNLPIIVSSSSMEIFDELSCLEAGADDYLRIGFSESIIFARVRALLRRARAKKAEFRGMQVGQVLIDSTRFQAFCQNELIKLTPTEFKILSLLASRIGQTLDRSEILMNVWETDYVEDNRLVDSHVRNLRKKLSKHPTNLVVVSARGVGYRLVLERNSTGQGPNHRKNGPLPVVREGNSRSGALMAFPRSRLHLSSGTP